MGVSPHSTTAGTQIGVALATEGLQGHGEGERGHLGLFPISQLGVKRDLLKTIQRELGGQEAGAPGEARGPHTTKRW